MKLDAKVFWRNAKQRRLELELSQAEMANRLGFSDRNYSAKERGVSPRLPTSLAEAVARALDTTVEELMKDTQEKNVYNQQNSIEQYDKYDEETFDISHLPKSVARFLSDKGNEKLVISMVVDYLMNERK